jgi:hypothetical protein
MVPPFACAGPQTDAVVARLNAMGTFDQYTQIVGGSGFESGEGIALDPVGNAYVIGRTDSSDFPATPGVVQASGTGTNAFAAKIIDMAIPEAGPPPPLAGGKGKTGAFCVITMVASGSPLAGGLETLRRFRDRALLTGAPGQALVRFYYAVSPLLAPLVASNGVARWATWLVLGPVVAMAALALAAPGLALAIGGAIALVGAILLVGVARRRVVALGVLVAGVFIVLLASLSLWSAPARERARDGGAPPSSVAASRQRGPLGPPAAPADVPDPAPSSTGAVADVSRADLRELRSLLPDLRLSIVPIPARGVWIDSPVVEAMLDGEGLDVIDPRALARFGLEPGDHVRSLDGWPVTGLLVVLQRLARDPDAALVQIELERQKLRMVQPLRLR